MKLFFESFVEALVNLPSWVRPALSTDKSQRHAIYRFPKPMLNKRSFFNDANEETDGKESKQKS